MSLFLCFIPIVTNTSPFQNPLSDPVTPTVSRRGKEPKSPSTKEPARFVDGATQTESMARKKKSGMRMYCLNDRDGRRVSVRRLEDETVNVDAA